MVRLLTEKRSYWKWFVNADHAFVYSNVLLNIWFDHQWRSWKSQCLQKYVSWYPLPEVMAPLKKRKKERIEKFSVTPCCQISSLLPKSWRWKAMAWHLKWWEKKICQPKILYPTKHSSNRHEKLRHSPEKRRRIYYLQTYPIWNTKGNPSSKNKNYRVSWSCKKYRTQMSTHI